MKSIYASKLYKGSRRKSAIKAAVEDPINVELIQQLNEYLDAPYQPVEKPDTVEPDESEDKKIRPSEGGGAGGGGYSSGLDDGGADLGELTEEFESERSDDFDEPSPDETPSEDVGESTKLKGKAVLGSEMVESIVDASDEIKGLLNSRSDSTGVVKVAVIDNILHVYFGEDINLNEVMEPAISVLNAAGYSALNFKKLSRSDNAMTFDIDEVPNPMKPVTESDE